MTRMLPARPHASATKSEHEVFRIIRDSPGSEQCACLHSLGLARHKRKAYAECDFVFISERGVYCLEVKGGMVQRREGQWHIGWEGRTYTSHEGPFKQAQQCKWAILQELKDRRPRGFSAKVPVGWGVVFPDICFEESDPEWDNQVIFDRRDKSRPFVHYIDRLADYTLRREETAGRSFNTTLSGSEVEMLVGIFRHDFDLVPSLSDLVAESEQELVSLSSQQYSILEFALHASNRRVLCPGAAGTGKTLVALEAVRRLGEEGQRVLVLCYNKLLAGHLKRQLAGLNTLASVYSLHGFMRRVIDKAGLADRLSSLSESNERQLFRQHFPRVFQDAILELLETQQFERYDTLIIDEGQDILHSPAIDAVECLIEGGFADGRWLIFYDPGLQSVLYGGMDPAVLASLERLQPAVLPLGTNFRNPRGVVREMCELTGIKEPICARTIVSSVEYRSYRNEKEQAKKLKMVLVDLLREGVDPRRVTILSGCRSDEACVTRYPPDIGKPITDLATLPSAENSVNGFTCSTVSAFKGLENDVIVLTDLPTDDKRSSWDRSVVYVGMTRARTKLFALVQSGFVSRRFPEAGEDNERID